MIPDDTAFIELLVREGHIMIAMHYAIDLPSDYDMEIVRRRVRDNGHKTDGFNGLKMKAYLIAEKGKYGNSRNQYAPFYVWETVEGMNEFLLEGPFDNILQSFGCPQVRTWFVIRAAIRKAASPGIARVDFSPLSPYSDLNGATGTEGETAGKLPESTSFVSAYNPASWEMCRAWLAPSGAGLEGGSHSGLVYDIHHIS